MSCKIQKLRELNEVGLQSRTAGCPGEASKNRRANRFDYKIFSGEIARVAASSFVSVSRELEAKLKLTSTFISTGVGSPSRIVGSYFRLETALNAAGIKRDWPLMTRIPATLPRSSIIASITTTPVRRDCLARGGYTGGGPKSRRGGFTAPPTCTGVRGPSRAGGGGAPLGNPPRTPPTAPPTWPPGIPPDTPPGTPPIPETSGVAISALAAIALGMKEGAVRASGVKVRTGIVCAG